MIMTLAQYMRMIITLAQCMRIDLQLECRPPSLDVVLNLTTMIVVLWGNEKCGQVYTSSQEISWSFSEKQTQSVVLVSRMHCSGVCRVWSTCIVLLSDVDWDCCQCCQALLWRFHSVCNVSDSSWQMLNRHAWEDVVESCCISLHLSTCIIATVLAFVSGWYPFPYMHTYWFDVPISGIP